MIMKKITLDPKRFDTNPKRLFLGPNNTRIIVDLEEYLRHYTKEEIEAMDDGTDHLCMAWMYIGDLKKTDPIFDQTGIKPTNNTEVGVMPLQENGWKIGKEYGWAPMIIVDPDTGELDEYRNGRRRTFNCMDIKEDWIPVAPRVRPVPTTSPVMDRVLSGSFANKGDNKVSRDRETLITNGVAIIKANEGKYVRTKDSIAKVVESPYPEGLDVYADFSDRNGSVTIIKNGIWNRTANSDDLTRIMDNELWGEWYDGTPTSFVYKLEDIDIICTDGQACESFLNVQVLKQGIGRKPTILYSKKDTPTKAVKSVSDFLENLELRLKDCVRLMGELGIKVDPQILPQSGLRPWNVVGVMPLLNSGKFKKYYENGMLIPKDEFLRFNTTNLFHLSDEDTTTIEEAVLGNAA